jgi:two-component system phosphate regulon sensor histidine kinase PhoR
MAGARLRRKLVGALLLLVAAVLLPAATLVQVAPTVAVARRAVWTGGALALGLVLVAGLLLSRRLTGLLLGMTRAARAMAAGDFAAPLPPPPGDELGDLVRALGTLRAQLAARLQELAAEGEKLRTVLDGMSEGVALIQEGRITVANPAFARLAGAREEVEGRPPLDAARLPEMGEAIAAAIASRRPAERELQVGERSLSVRARPLGPRPAGQAVVVLHDSTEARRNERIRRELVANASHELRTPVAAVVAAAETLAGGAGDEPEARATFVDILLRHAHRLSRLTSDLLDLSRLEAGWQPKVEAVEVRASANTVLSALAPRAEERKISVETDLPEGLRAAGDRAALEQILTNLVDNALKYTPPGGRVRVSAARLGSEVTVAVADTGPGIAAAHLPRLFERFYRVDAARSRELGGTGLGLAIVKHLAAACNGRVDVASEVGRGSTFTLHLPSA